MTRTRKRAPSVRERRRARERAIVAATRELFDERARRDASVDEIARAAGLSKALIYRAFDSKEEIFLIALSDYLSQLNERRGELAAAEQEPAATLREVCELYADFCLEYPAFLDCSLALMQRPAQDLREEVSGAAWARLGGALAGCVGPVAEILSSGAEQGVFADADADLTANRICLQMLGTMHLARIGLGAREIAPGVGEAFEIDPAQVRAACVGDALALATAPQGAPA